MYWLKQCTKCGGDLVSNSDQYGPYISCMQCGQYRDIEIKEAVSPVKRPGTVQPSTVAVLIREGYRSTTRPSSPDRRLVAVSA